MHVACVCRYDSLAHILLFLNHAVFTDLVFSRFDIFFNAALADEQLWTIFPIMLKGGREPARPQLVQKHLIIIQAILQHILADELPHLRERSHRASMALKLAEVAFKRFPDPNFKEVRAVACHQMRCLAKHGTNTTTFMQVQLQPLIPVYKRLLTTCMKHLRESPYIDNYLALLRMACKAVSQKGEVQHNGIISHVVESGVVADLLRLLFSMLEGPTGNTAQRDQIAGLLLQMPCHLSDLIKQDALTKLTKPLLLAFQSTDQEIVALAFQVMELWTDSLTPHFLDAKMQVQPQKAPLLCVTSYFFSAHGQAGRQ
jgi:hypothetical protein